jgi:hypothetical protein
MEKASMFKWIKGRFDTKTWAILGLAGATIVISGALVVQWKYASLGHQVQRNVVKFLMDHGAQVRDGVISGGVVATPMRVNTAINATVVQMLNAVAEQIDVDKPSSPSGGGGAPIDGDFTQYENLPLNKKQPRGGRRRIGPQKSAQVSSPQPPNQHRGAPANSPLEIGKPRDDDGYMTREKSGGQRRRGGAAEDAGDSVHDYNPNEFKPQSARPPPAKASVFSDVEDSVGPVDDGDDYQ